MRYRLIPGAALALTLLVAVSCQQTTATKSTPGALPEAPVSDVQPKLSASSYFAHGHLLERQGHFQRAAEQYREALKLQPDFPTARTRLGIVLNKLGRHAEASAEFRRAIQLMPGRAFLYNNLGFSLYLEGQLEEADAVLKRALEIQPDFARAHMNRGIVLAKMDRFDEAFDELSQAGDKADAYYNIGMLQTEAGRYADAARSFELALQTRPNFEPARANLKRVARLAAKQPAAAALPGDAALTNFAATTLTPEMSLLAEDASSADAPSGAIPAAPPAPAPESTADSHDSPPTQSSSLDAAPLRAQSGLRTTDVLEFWLPGSMDAVLASDVQLLDQTVQPFASAAAFDLAATHASAAPADAALRILERLILALINGEEPDEDLWCELEAELDAIAAAGP
jgi:Flp pilus assembly protein TadD